MRRAILVCVVATLCGCATIYSLSSDRMEGEMHEDTSHPRSLPRLYSGVVVDGYCVGQSFSEGREAAGQIGFFCLLDVPLSLVVDTLVLPYTAYQQIRFGNFKPRFVEAEHAAALKRAEQSRQDRQEACRRLLARDAGDSSYQEWCRRQLEPDAEMPDAGAEASPVR